jgi:microcystin-dependent protein
VSESTPTPGDATSIEAFVRSDLFRAILRTQHADLLSASTNASSTVPTGVVAPFAAETAPDGWLLCNGQDVYKDTYPALYALVQTKYGTPADTLKFRLPDLQGRVPVGYGTGYTTLNAPSGDATVTLDTTQIPAHSHEINSESPGTNSVQPRFYNTSGGVAAGTSFNVPGTAGGAFNWYDVDSHSHTVNPHSHGGATKNAGGGASHSNMQPYIVLNYIIRT